MAKNERQRTQNLAHPQNGRGQGQATGPNAPTRAERTREIERTLATTQASTASMGKFDRTLEGEKKPRGMKRKVRVNAMPPLSIMMPLFLTLFVLSYCSSNRRKSQSKRKRARICR